MEEYIFGFGFGFFFTLQPPRRLKGEEEGEEEERWMLTIHNACVFE